MKTDLDLPVMIRKSLQSQMDIFRERNTDLDSMDVALEREDDKYICRVKFFTDGTSFEAVSEDWDVREALKKSLYHFEERLVI